MKNNNNPNISTVKLIALTVIITIFANCMWSILYNYFGNIEICKVPYLPVQIVILLKCPRPANVNEMKPVRMISHSTDMMFPFIVDNTGVTEFATKKSGDDFRNVPQYVGNQLFTENEAKHVLFAAKISREKGNLKKALVIIENALAKAPKHPEILMEYGIIIESTSKDLVLADSIYYKVLNCDPNHEGALMRRQKILPVVLAYDNRIIKELYVKRESFYKIKKNVSAFRRALRESYYQHVYHTVALEGNTMSYIQTRTFLETGRAIGGKSIFEHNEILGLDAALRFLNQSKIQLGAITLSDILQIHHKVLAFVDPDNAGKFRDVQVYIGPFTPPGPEFVVNEMKQFIDWLNDEASLEMDCVELAAIAHYKFVFIHPFIDGNGRTGRLLMNLILSRSGFPPIIIPVEERLTYYQALKEANDGDLRPFIRFIVSQTDKTLQKFIDSVSTCTSDTEDCLDEPGQRIEIPEDTDKNRLDATK